MKKNFVVFGLSLLAAVAAAVPLHTMDAAPQRGIDAAPQNRIAALQHQIDAPFRPAADADGAGLPLSSAAPAALQVVSEEVSWPIGETTVYATVTRPAEGGPFPAVVFVPGSGPTDRNWNTPLLPGTNGSALLLAEELARRGFVTIRYDKRFAGPRAKENLPHLAGKISLDGHAEEIAGAVEQLLALPCVAPDRIYVLANSEGTIHALNYHLKHGERFAGLVLTAPPGRSMSDLIEAQIGAQLRGVPGGDKMMAGFEALMAGFLEGKPFAADPALPAPLNNLAKSWHANLPFTREIFPLDPAELLKQVTAPVLVVIGKKDIQVDWEVDGGLLEKAATGLANLVFEFPENANHVLKHEPKPRANLTAADGQAYNAEGKVLDEETVRIIAAWLGRARDELRLEQHLPDSETAPRP